MTEQQISHQSGWFFVAAELSRRGYRLSIPQGKVLPAKISVSLSGGRKITVEVRAVLKEGSSWLFGEVSDDRNTYFVLVAGIREEILTQPKYWVLRSSVVKNILDQKAREGKTPQILKSEVHGHEDAWDILLS